MPGGEMKKASPVWLVLGVSLILTPVSILLNATASTRAGNYPKNHTNVSNLPGAPPMMTFTVTTTADTGAGSLRAAIDLANTNPGPDLINFNLGAGTPTINVGAVTGTPLQAITDAVTIDGATGGST